jgi:hypothetical protein
LSERRPFCFPVVGPDGVALTELGKPHDPTGSHAHHDSLWVAHANVNGVDFWSERGGVIAHERFEVMEDGPVFSRLVQAARWLDGTAELLSERRTVMLHRTPEAYRLLDVELALTPAGTREVTFARTTFGFLAARVAQSLTVFDGGGAITNARGGRNERGCHLKRAEWIDLSGPIGPDRWGGIALLDHPDNPRHPTVWHCRDDGWAGAALCADGPFVLEAGATLRLRYRVVLHRGDVVTGEVAARFAEFAARPTVELGPVR